MLSKGLSLEVVSDVTGLSVEELETLLSQESVRNKHLFEKSEAVFVSFFIFGYLTFVILKHSENNTLNRKIKKDCQTFDINLRKQI